MVLTFCVSCGAYLLEDQWLQAGHEVWEHLRGGAPFFAGRPSADLQGFSGSQAGYRESSASSQALFRHLTVAADDGKPFLPQGAGLFWTEHAERNWLPSAAAAVGRHRDELQRLGRWQADCSEAYVRTSKVIILTRFKRKWPPKPDNRGETSWTRATGFLS